MITCLKLLRKFFFSFFINLNKKEQKQNNFFQFIFFETW
jgi:hypothetical protein